jgi:hypothetical protein
MDKIFKRRASKAEAVETEEEEEKGGMEEEKEVART